jgi:hypothetical protein
MLDATSLQVAVTPSQEMVSNFQALVRTWWLTCHVRLAPSGILNFLTDGVPSKKKLVHCFSKLIIHQCLLITIQAFTTLRYALCRASILTSEVLSITWVPHCKSFVTQQVCTQPDAIIFLNASPSSLNRCAPSQTPSDSRKTKRSLPKHCITSFGIGTDGRWLHLTNWRVKAGQELVLARNPHVLASTESVGSRVLCVAHNLVMAPKIPST